MPPSSSSYHHHHHHHHHHNHNHNHLNQPSHEAHFRAHTPEPVSPLASDFPLPGTANNARFAHYLTYNNVYDMSPLSTGGPGSPRMMSPSPSISSHSNSTFASNLPANIANIYPPPAYVAQFGASQVVGDRKRRYSNDDEDDEDDDVRTVFSSMRDDVQFSTAALSLANAFLDQLLYSIIGQARSTTLTALRPAVVEVLRSRLAVEAIASAEEELHELLAGGDEEEDEMNSRQTLAEQSRNWDTELVWKRTRLRVMVYIRLGEMEDDDEERYVREEDLFHSGTDRRFSHSAGLVSWAAAIFLTSVIEYVAEQTLQVAAQAADSRARRQSRNPRVAVSASGVVTPVDGATVEDYDMEKVALNSALGRLWRTWRKSLRSNANGAPSTLSTSNNNFSRRRSRDVFGAAAMSPGRSSFGMGPESPAVSAMDDSRRPSLISTTDRDVNAAEAEAEAEAEGEAEPEELPEAEYPEHVLAANIPLPMGNETWDIEDIEQQEDDIAASIPIPMLDARRDVDEIELPGLARDPDAAESDERIPSTATGVKRRYSCHAGSSIMTTGTAIAPKEDLEIPETSQTLTGTQKQPVLTRQRSASAPHPAKQHMVYNAEPVVELPTAPVEQRDAASEDMPADKPEQKADAAEMAMHKRMASQSPASEPLHDAVVQVDPAKEISDEHGDDKTVLGAAAAGSAAAALAAWSTVYGAQHDQKDARKSMPSSSTDIEQRDQDNRSRDMKRLTVPVPVKQPSLQRLREHDEARTAKRVSLSSPTTPALIVRTHSSSPSASPRRDTFDSHKDGEQSRSRPRYVASDSALRQEATQELVVDIGVAKTSDTAVSTPHTDEPSSAFRYARDHDSYTNPNPRRPSRLFIGEPPAEASPAWKDSPPVQPNDDVPATTPEAFLSKRSLSVSPKSPPAADAAPEQSQSHSRRESTREPSNAASKANAAVTTDITHGPQPPPRLEKVPFANRQTLNAEKSTTRAPHNKPSSSVSDSPSTVQQRPVLQKMTVVKKQDPTQKEQSVSLTSASIKGPEDFEMFVQGGDTVKYTLTPETVRDDPSPTDALPIRKSGRNHERNFSEPRRPSPLGDSRTGRSQSSKNITSATPLPSEPDDDRRPRRNSEKRRSISRPPVRNLSVHRRSGLMAREPQVQTESTRDFADFIRSTGPSKEQEVLPILKNRSTTSLASLGGKSRSSSVGAASARSLNRSGTPKTSLPPMPAMPTKRKASLSARDAKTNHDGGTSDLIDFIRSGPHSDGQSGQPREHRISRSVAPFRTTMDSDQMTEWGERLVAQPDLKLNTPNVPGTTSPKSSFSKSSHRASANSKAPLLPPTDTSETVHPAHSGVPQRLSSMPAKSHLSVPDAPAVKRGRNKDPYAVDFDDDDEDEDLLTALPKNARIREEESLIDFLKNSEPPAPRPRTTNGGPAPTSQKSKSISIPGRGADAISMGSRGGSMPHTDGAAKRALSIAAGNAPAGNAPAPLRGTTTSIAVGPISNPPRHQVPKMEARGFNKYDNGGVRDLADFLRTSGPADNVRSVASAPAAAPQSKRKESRNSVKTSDTSKSSSARKSGFWGFFSGRGKKNSQAQAQYLDM